MPLYYQFSLRRLSVLPIVFSLHIMLLPSTFCSLSFFIATSIAAQTCIDRLTNDRVALTSLLHTPPSNVSIAGLHFGEQRMFYGIPFKCNGTITRVTFAAASSSTGTDLPELGVWNELIPFNLYVKSAGLLLTPCITGQLEVEVEGMREMVEIHELVPDPPLAISSSQWPAVFLPENRSYALQLYLFNVVDVPIELNEMSYLSFFQRRSVIQTSFRIVVVNAGNLLPLMALEICPDNSTSCEPTESVTCLNSPTPSLSMYPSLPPPPGIDGSIPTLTIILATVLPAALLLICFTMLAISIFVYCTCYLGQHKQNNDFTDHAPNQLEILEMTHNLLSPSPLPSPSQQAGVESSFDKSCVQACIRSKDEGLVPERIGSNDMSSQVEELIKELPGHLVVMKEQLRLLDVIGQGMFGVVYRAVLTKGLPGFETKSAVAVKTLKGLFTPHDVHCMVEEILKMKEFSHPNVMGLLGVCLNPGAGVAIVMPYMGNGSLLSYLKKDKKALILPSSADAHTLTVVRKLLLRMCHQIALGMEYLSRHKFIHRDLAARNCMLDNEGNLKVADFGLAEDVYTADYFRQGQESGIRLPYKWMPAESLHYGLFTEKSDVWSFGVTCWEVFSAGKIPYPAIDPATLLKLLEGGQRLEFPVNAACSTEIYLMMQQCWCTKPETRPTFEELVAIISPMLEVVADYTELSMTLTATTKEGEKQEVAVTSNSAYQMHCPPEEISLSTNPGYEVYPQVNEAVIPAVKSNPAYQLHHTPEYIPLSTNPGYKVYSQVYETIDQNA